MIAVLGDSFLTDVEAIAMVCGIMVGSGIFASPADMLCKVRHYQWRVTNVWYSFQGGLCLSFSSGFLLEPLHSVQHYASRNSALQCHKQAVPTSI